MGTTQSYLPFWKESTALQSDIDKFRLKVTRAAVTTRLWLFHSFLLGVMFSPNQVFTNWEGAKKEETEELSQEEN